MAECYYFAPNGYVLTNTTIDGSEVNADGAWVVNGVVQTQTVHPNAGTYAWANFSQCNSIEGENALKGTLVYSQGTISNITFVSAKSYLKSYDADFTDIDGNVWLLRLDLTDNQLNELKTRTAGKTISIFGKYDGYSDKVSRPVITPSSCLIDGQGFFFMVR